MFSAFAFALEKLGVESEDNSSMSMPVRKGTVASLESFGYLHSQSKTRAEFQLWAKTGPNEVVIRARTRESQTPKTMTTAGETAGKRRE